MNYEYSDKTGVVCEGIKWIPTPNYIQRRRAVVDIIDFIVAEHKTGAFPKLLEFGFGTGVLTYEFFIKGFDCKGVDLSPAAVEVANLVFDDDVKGSDKLAFTLSNGENAEDYGKFDYVAAFEVLEHIEDDKAAILDWKKYIKDGGYLFISSPCHMKKFGNLDKFAGHFRRYEKNELTKMLEECGFSIEKFYCSGFPMMTMLKPILERKHYKQKQEDVASMTLAEKTAQSGFDKNREWKYKSILKPLLGVIGTFCNLQRCFYNTDLGVNYVVLAKKVQ
jgi:SAM-dependent methyltransferase